MNNNAIKNLKDPADIKDAANKEYVDTKVAKAGDTMTGQLNLYYTNPNFFIGNSSNSGKIQFINANNQFKISASDPSSNKLAVNINDLLYAHTNNRIGINKTNPSFMLDISGDINFTGNLFQNNSIYVPSTQWTTSGSNIYNSNVGNVGIGITNPSHKLDIVGNINVASGNTYKINGSDVLTTTSLGSSVTSSSLTSVGTLTSLTISGDLTIDTNTFKVDSSNNRVGINITNPSNSLSVKSTDNIMVSFRKTSDTGNALLEVGQDSTNNAAYIGWESDKVVLGRRGVAQILTYDSSGTNLVGGNIGIGISNPSYKLDINGRTRITNDGDQLIINNSTTNASWNIIEFSTGIYNGNTNRNESKWEIGLKTESNGSSNDSDRFYIGRAGIPLNDFTVVKNGYVGIGTTNPGTKLQINTPSDNLYGNNSFSVLDIAIFGKSFTPSISGNTNMGGTLFINSNDSFAVGSGSSIALGGRTFNFGSGNLHMTAARLSGIITNNAYEGALTLETMNNGLIYERMRINSSGNVGIGTTNPLSILDVVSNSGADAGNRRILTNFVSSYTTADMTHNLRLQWYSDFWDMGVTRGPATGIEDLVFRRNGTERMRITSGGSVGIATTSPLTRLDIRYNSSTSTLTGTTAYGSIHLVPATNSDGTYAGISFGANGSIGGLRTGSQAAILCQTSDTPGGSYTPGSALHFLTTDAFVDGQKLRMTINKDGNVGIGTTNPTQKLDVNGNISCLTNLICKTGDPTIFTSLSSARGYGASLILSANEGGTRPYEIISSSNAAGSGGGRLAIYDGTVGVAAYRTILCDDSGRMGIGTTNPTQLLTLNAIYNNGGDPTQQINNRIKMTATNSFGCEIQLMVPPNATLNDSSLVFTTPNNAGNQIQRMTILGSSNSYGGNVGIGVTNPAGALTITRNYGSLQGTEQNTNELRFQSTNSDSIYWSGIRLRVRGDRFVDEGDLQFLTTSSGNPPPPPQVRMTIKGSSLPYGGNVGIGTDDPTEKLQVNGNIYIQTYGFYGLTGGNSNGYLYGAFNTLGDGIHIGYNYYNNNTNHVITNVSGETSRISMGYGFVGIYTGSVNTVPNTLGYYQNSSGNVGIGKTNPVHKLDVGGTLIVYPDANNYIGLTANQTYGAAIAMYPAGTANSRSYELISSNGNASIGGNRLAIYDSTPGINTYRTVLCDSNGNMGVGVTTNATITEKLQVVGNINVGDGFGSANLVCGISRFSIQPSGTERFSILQSNGNVGINITNPSYRLHVNENLVTTDLTGATMKSQLCVSDGGQQLLLGSYYEAGVYQGSAIQSQETGVGNIRLLLNPRGGNVGIGMTVPTGKLTVYEESSDTLSNNTTSSLMLVSDADYGFPGGNDIGSSILSYGRFASNRLGSLVPYGKIGMYKESGSNYTDSYMAFFTNRDQDRVNGSSSLLSEKMRITSTGNVGIATNNPLTRLDVRYNSSTSTLTGTTAYGSIHLVPATNSDGTYAGISFGANGSIGGLRTGSQAAILCQTSDTPGGSYTAGSALHFLTTDAFTDGQKLRMTINKDGNVGIGTTNPARTLSVISSDLNMGSFRKVNDTGDAWIEIGQNTTANAAYLGWESNKVVLGKRATAPILTYDASGTNLSGGNVGINNPNPIVRLDVAGQASIYNPSSTNNYDENLRLPVSSGGFSTIVMGNSVTSTTGMGTNVWALLKDGAVYSHNFSIRYNGNRSVVIDQAGNLYCTAVNPSDSRIKKDIEIISDGDALNKLRLIEPKTYYYKDPKKETQGKVYGFIAQDVYQVLPDAIKIGINVIPDILENANINKNIITFSNNINLNIGDRIRYTLNGEGKLNTIIEILENNSYKIDISDINIDVSDNNIDVSDNNIDVSDNNIDVSDNNIDVSDNEINEIFVYGREINDFHFLKKDYLFTLNFAATQELDRQIQNLTQENSYLKEQLNNLMARIELLENK
jgi:hypothetical protein